MSCRENTLNNEEKENKQFFICVSCSEADDTPFKLMPCLHLCCISCLEKLVKQNSIAMPSNDLNLKCSIFPCLSCGYVVRVVNEDFNSLKSIDMNLKKRNGNVNSKYFSVSFPLLGCSDQNVSSLMCCKESSFEKLRLYCTSCEVFVCSECLLHNNHENHELSPCENYLEDKKHQLQRLCIKVDSNITDLLNHLRINKELQKNLSASKEEVKAQIMSRVQDLYRKIDIYKDNLLAQLDTEYSHCLDDQKLSQNKFKKNVETLKECLHFCKEMMTEDQMPNFMNIYNELFSHINRVLAKQEDVQTVIRQFRLEIDNSREDSFLDKLFGNVVVGSIAKGSSHPLGKYQTDISWPICLATNGKEFLIAGKSETFSEGGKLLFCDRDMKSLEYVSLECVPVDLLHLPENWILLSRNDGSIQKYSFQGKLLDHWQNVFEGTFGQMANFGLEEFLLTTGSSELTVCRTSDGMAIQRFKIETASPIRSMATHNKQIYCILESNDIQSFEKNGTPITNASFSCEAKCPSDIFCDPFGNLLVADFTNDSVLFFDRSGTCLGPILDKGTDLISCPNVITLDSYGNLYVGQYGGAVSAFNYLSCMKKV